MRRFNTLRVRFAFWIAVLMLLVLAAFGMFVYVAMSKWLNMEIDDVLRLSASQVLASIDLSRDTPGLSESFLQSPANSELKKHGLAIQLLDHKANQLESLGPNFNLAVNEAIISSAKRGEATLETVVDPSMSSPIRVYNLPLKYKDKFVGILQVAQALTTVQNTLRRLRDALLVSIPLLVILSGVTGYLLAAHTLATIDQITRTARQISAKDLTARLNLPASNDEVGRLAVTFDQMLDRLAKSFQRERQFSADASHELRTPLSVMQAILSTTIAKRRTVEEYEQALTDLSDETTRLGRLVETLLYLSHSEAHPADHLEQIDLSALLTDMCDSFHPLAEEKGLSLTCSVPNHLEITGDCDGLIRLFFNLIDNAIKYTNQGGITISATKNEADRTLSVAVTDTGIGIAPEHQECVFDRFYRVERSRTSNSSGLGLAIAREIARNHGGDIQLTSQVGQGSVFSVKLVY
jgi:heavy metal sensor kinase